MFMGLEGKLGWGAIVLGLLIRFSPDKSVIRHLIGKSISIQIYELILRYFPEFLPYLRISYLL